MKQCLVDVNVLLPLLVRHHKHHRAARKWLDSLSAREAGVCRLVQLALARLLANRSIMAGFAIPASEAWRLIRELIEDERLEFVTEPSLIDNILPKLFRHPVPAPNLITDAYLAAFALAANRRIATFDRGFRQFDELEVELVPD
jgi:uncharacterized protein